MAGGVVQAFSQTNCCCKQASSHPALSIADPTPSQHQDYVSPTAIREQKQSLSLTTAVAAAPVWRPDKMMEALVKRVEEMELPKAGTVCAFVILSYFLVTAGIAYDIINEPPAIGAQEDPATGKVKPVTFMPYRMNGQYIIEGISGGMMYTIGGLSIMALHKSQNKRIDEKLRIILLGLGFFGLLMAYGAVMVFLGIKMPGYLK